MKAKLISILLVVWDFISIFFPSFFGVITYIGMNLFFYWAAFGFDQTMLFIQIICGVNAVVALFYARAVYDEFCNALYHFKDKYCGFINFKKELLG